MKFYVEYLDSKNQFRETRKFFESFEDARIWCLETMEKFDLDYIKEI